jgi:dihydrofolate synthase/folylpolyglutamate synthase
MAQGACLIDVERAMRWRPLSMTAEGSDFGVDGTVRAYPHLEIPLAGPHQILNAATAIATAEQLEAQGLPIAAQGIALGLQQVHWEGRLETVSRQPWIVLDGAHNRDSARCLRETLTSCFKYRRLILILGISANKDLQGIVEELTPLAAVTIVTRATVSRAAPPQQVADLAAKSSAAIIVEEDPQKALAHAIAELLPGDLLLVTGSLYLVGDAKQLLPTLLAPSATPLMTQVPR